ncbi:predicted protein [Plenodomus lingam JN3]|uniref:Predicted protein n=1 Tax=Leptosphaeria maculans (strain JN3 / isolate v23.1.3 / race Av1-4-5-6-7-8) TaxID=985895 RepID=E5A207_LEPMJ|nr:predicted protein [Plenodomus lingam JN3]CBX97724.1 predicted protein [Plenodomus lingam JN3]
MGIHEPRKHTSAKPTINEPPKVNISRSQFQVVHILSGSGSPKPHASFA